MFLSQTVNKFPHTLLKWHWIYVLILGLSLQFLGMHHREAQSQEIPLLLSHGLTSSQAEIELLLYIPAINSSLDLSQIEENLSIPQDWSWERKIQVTGDGHKHLLILGKVQVTSPETEAFAFRTFQQLVKEIKPYQGKAYWHEQVNEGVDPAAYLNKINATPMQWALSGNTLSIAAQTPAISDYVVAGSDKINIQVLTRQTQSGSMTVVAVPVLLAEF